MSRLIVFLALLLAPLLALAHDRVPTPGPSTSGATSASAAVSNSGGGSVAGGDSWAVALPGVGAPSYAGNYSICVRGKGTFWNFAWSWQPDIECIELVARLDRLRATPLPPPVVQILTAPPVEHEARSPVCTPLAKTTKLGRGCPA